MRRGLQIVYIVEFYKWKAQDEMDSALGGHAALPEHLMPYSVICGHGHMYTHLHTEDPYESLLRIERQAWGASSVRVFGAQAQAPEFSFPEPTSKSRCGHANVSNHSAGCRAGQRQGGWSLLAASLLPDSLKEPVSRE